MKDHLLVMCGIQQRKIQIGTNLEATRRLIQLKRFIRMVASELHQLTTQPLQVMQALSIR